MNNLRTKSGLFRITNSINDNFLNNIKQIADMNLDALKAILNLNNYKPNVNYAALKEDDGS